MLQEAFYYFRGCFMILVTRLNGSHFWINPELIQTVEANPDTVITLTNEEKWVVSESPEELIERLTAYKRLTWPQQTAGLAPNPD